MNRALDITWKDIKRFKPWLAVWLALAFFPDLIGFLDKLFTAGDIQWHTALLGLVFDGAWIQRFLEVLLVGLLIQEDKPAGTQGFWMTRPVSGTMLIKSKSLFTLLFLLLLPTAAWALFLALEGATGHDLFLASLETLFRFSEVALLSSVVAALAPSFSWFVPAAALAFFAHWIAGWWMVAVKLFRPHADNPFRADQLMVTDSIVVGFLTLLLGISLLAYQYRTRRHSQTLYAALLGLALLFFVQPFWSWNLQAPSIPRLKDTPDSLKLSLGKYTFEIWNDGLDYARPMLEYWGPIQVQGRQEGEDIRVAGLKTSLTLPDGKTLEDDGYDLNHLFPKKREPDLQAAQAFLGPLKIMNPERVPSPGDALLILDPKVYQKVLDHPVTYRADVDLVRLRYRAEGELDLSEKSGLKTGSGSVTLLEYKPSENLLQLKIQVQNLDLAFSRNPQVQRWFWFEDDNVFYVLVNRKKKEAFLSDPRPRFISVDATQAKQPLRVFQETLQFASDSHWPGKIPTLDKDWLKDATLLRVRMEPVGEFELPLVVPDFRLTENRGEKMSWAWYEHYVTYGLSIPSLEPSDPQVKDSADFFETHGKKLTTTGKSLLIDDFEGGTRVNKLGSVWVTDQDHDGILGTVMNPKPSGPFTAQSGGCEASPGHAAHIWGHFGKFQAPWPYVMLTSAFNLQSHYVDLSGFSAFRFYAKGDGKPYEMIVRRASVTDGCDFACGFTAPEQWTQVTLPFSDFTQDNWGLKVPPGWQDVKNISFSTGSLEFSDEDFDLWIDQLELVK